MANFSSEPQIGHVTNPTQEDSSKQIRLGTRAKDVDGNEFIYLQGTASVVAGNWVVWDQHYGTTLIAATSVGPVGVAATATVLGEYGWFQIFGKASASAGKSIAINKHLYHDPATSGYVDDADAATASVIGAMSIVASSGSAVTVWLTYPFMNAAAID